MAGLKTGLDRLLKAGEQYATENDLELTKADLYRLQAALEQEKASDPLAGAIYGYFIGLGSAAAAMQKEEEPLPWH